MTKGGGSDPSSTQLDCSGLNHDGPQSPAGWRVKALGLSGLDGS